MRGILDNINFRETQVTAEEADQENSGWYGPFDLDLDTTIYIQHALNDKELDLVVGVQKADDEFDNNEVYVKIEPKPQEVDSSMMTDISYDEVTQKLVITFKSGTVYHYYDVEQPIFDGLEQAESKGQFFSRHIRPWYKYKRVETEW